MNSVSGKRACLRVNLWVRCKGVVDLAAVRDAPESLNHAIAQHAHLRFT